MKTKDCQVFSLKNLKTVQEYRKQKRLSQKALAHLLGINRQQTISDWECGEYMPEPENLQKLAQILEVDTEILEASFRINKAINEVNKAVSALKTHNISTDFIVSVVSNLETLEATLKITKAITELKHYNIPSEVVLGSLN